MKIIKDGIICPFEGTMDSFSGGIIDPASGFVEDCLCHRGKPPQYLKPEQYISDPCVWGGMLFGHFGHFIWESLSRLVAIVKCVKNPVIFISPNPEVFNWQKLFFRTLGIHNKIILLKKPTLARQLVYVNPGISIQPLQITDEHLRAMERFGAREGSDRKIWLSRTRLKQGIAVNEPAIEAAIKKLGYEIIVPELLPLAEQIRLTATSRVVAGFDGSQFFSFLFAARPAGKFLIFNRRQNAAETLSYSLERKEIPHEVHNLKIEAIIADKGGNAVTCRAVEEEKIVNILAEA